MRTRSGRSSTSDCRPWHEECGRSRRVGLRYLAGVSVAGMRVWEMRVAESIALLVWKRGGGRYEDEELGGHLEDLLSFYGAYTVRRGRGE